MAKKPHANELLSYERERRHWTQDYVAKHIGAPDTKIVGKWERGITVPAPYYRQQLEMLFGKSARELGIVRNGDIPFWSVPYRQNLFFTAREATLTRLHTTFTATQIAPGLPVALAGLGGVGKTQTALEYAYRYRQEYQIVAWVQAYSREVLEADLAALAMLFNLPEKQEQEQKKLMKAIRQWFSSLTRWLLIFDNVDDFHILDDILPSPARGHILLTTRSQATGILAQAIEVEAMTPEEGAYFLLRRAKRVPLHTPLSDIAEDDFRLAREISHALGGLPLALDQAGAYIEETACSLAHCLKLYKDQREVFLQRRGEYIDNHPASVATTWSLAFEKIHHANPSAIELLHFLAFLAPDAIPQEIVTDGALEVGPLPAAFATEPLQFDRAIKDLRAFSLLKRNAETHMLTIHRLVQLVIRAQCEPETQRLWAEYAVRVLNRVFPDGTFGTWPQCERLLSQALACIELIEQWHMMFQEAAQLLQRVGNYLRQRARYASIERFYQRAITILEHLYGEEHLEIASLLTSWGELYFYLGKPTLAEPCFQRALAIRKKLLVPTHAALAQSLHLLGMIYVDLEHYALAEDLYQQALAIREQAVDTGLSELAESLGELGYLYWRQEKYALAEPLFQRALALHEQSLGTEHPRVGVDLLNVAAVYRQQGRYYEAEHMYLRAISLWQRTQGPEDPDVAYAQSGLAKLYVMQERLIEATLLYQQAYIILQKALGPDHPKSVSVQREIAQLHS